MSKTIDDKIERLLLDNIRGNYDYTNAIPAIKQLIAGAETRARIHELEELGWNFSGDNPNRDKLVNRFDDGSILYNVQKLEIYISDRLNRLESELTKVKQ